MNTREIRERLNATSPGPWHLRRGQIYFDFGGDARQGSCPIVVADGGCDYCDPDAKFQHEDDAIFVAHAREDVENLLDELDLALAPILGDADRNVYRLESDLAAARRRIAELERMLEHEAERYLTQLHRSEKAEKIARTAERQLYGQTRGNAKLLAQIKAQGAILRSRGIEDRPIGFPDSGPVGAEEEK